MKRISFISICALAVLTVVSCSSNNLPDYTDSPFKVGSSTFATLQEAMDNANSREDECVVTMMANASGEGARLDYDTASVYGVTLDMQSYTYTLLGGCSIITNNTRLTLKGNGGRLLTEDETALLKVQDFGDLVLSGDVNISAENAIEADSSYVETNGFSGTLDGNIALNESKFILNDSACCIVADTLRVYGESAVFAAYTDPQGSQPTATIGKVLFAGNEYPVVAESADVIKVKDGEVHVHNYSSETIGGTCMTDEVLLKTCSQCGNVSPTHTGIYGSCPREGLVHHNAVAASELECGNIEYWDCPLCGKTFTDAGGENAAESSVYIQPKSYILGDSLLYDNDFVMDWNNLGNDVNDFDPSALGPFGMIFGCISLFNNIIGAVTDKTALYWKQLYQGLEAVKAKLEVIDQKLNHISSQITAIPYRIKISDRSSMLSGIKFKTYQCDSLCVNIFFNNKLKEADKNAKLESALKFYCESTYGGVPYCDVVKKLMHEYYTGVVGETVKNYPEMWGDYINSMVRWEHHGYKPRAEIMANDIIYLVKGYAMTYYYYMYVKYKDNPQGLRIALQELESLKQNYVKACEASVNSMKERYSRLRQFTPLHVCYGLQPRTRRAEEYYNSFKSHRTDRTFPRDNENNKAAESINKMLKEDHNYPDTKYMTPVEAKKIYEICTNNKGEKQSLYYILSDSLQADLLRNFYEYRQKERNYQHILCGPFESSFAHYDDDSGKPHYNMFAWESWRSSRNKDSFSIKCWSTDATISIEKIIYNCNISTWGSDKGQITNPGSYSNNKFYSIPVVN